VAPVRAAVPRATAKPDRTRFDPPSLRRAKAEPLPGLRELAEFIHPLLAMTGFSLFIGYVLTRNWVIGATALGVAVGTAAAGLSWAFVNARNARSGAPDRYALNVTPRLLLIHACGAVITIALTAAAVIVAR
jgi:hypothetical protein